MKKKTLLIFSLFIHVTGLFAQNTTFEPAAQAVSNMKIGWNLGNTLDSHLAGVNDPALTEILRNQVTTTPELMDMLKDAGFGAVRVPVTWWPHMSADGTVDAAWMARVKEVVDYVINQGMYCIIDVHHDGGTEGGTFPGKAWIKATMSNYNDNKERFEYLWTQIANAFKDYGQLLIFEGYNELLDMHASWNFASQNTANGYDHDVEMDAYSAINHYAQSFVNAVRATGGNNLQRNLIVKTYASACGRGNWNLNLHHPLDYMELPNDVEKGHIIFGVHSYPRIRNTDGTHRALRDCALDLDWQFYNLEQYLATKGSEKVPIVLCEWASANVDANPTDYEYMRSRYLSFAEDFVKRCKEAGIAPFYWMGLSNKTFRGMPAFNEPDLAETMLKAYYGEDYKPLLPVKSDYDVNYAIKFNRSYGEVILVNEILDLNEYKAIRVEAAYSPRSDANIRLKVYHTNDGENSSFNYKMGMNTLLDFDTRRKEPNPILKDSIYRITIQIGKSTVNEADTFTISRVVLLKKNGEERELEPTLWYNNNNPNAGFTVRSTPLFIKNRISDAHASTLYYGDKNLIVPEGVEALTYKIENGKLAVVKTYQPSDVIPAGTGVVLTSETPGPYMYRYTAETGEVPTGNMLRGSDKAEVTTGGDIYYMLSLNHSNDPESVGFYFGKPGGAPFINGAHKAYLAVQYDASYTSFYCFADAEDSTTTEISTTNFSLDQAASAAPQRWTTLDGRNLKKAPTTPGVYLQNGKKVYINRTATR